MSSVRRELITTTITCGSAIVFVEAGAAVKTGDPIAEIETDKATFTVEAERDGYILGFTQPLGEMIAVGSVLGWIGNFPDEAVPTDNQPTAHAAVPAEPTLKAARLLAQFGLNANEVPASGERLSAQDVLAYVERHPRTPYQPPAPAAIEPSADLPSGEAIPFSAIERGMMKAVLWHRQSAVAGYVEIQYSTDAWQQYADAFQSHHKLLINPLLPLMAYRLVQLGRENPKLNSTIRGDERYQYANVNLGFTLQSGGSFIFTVRERCRHARGEGVCRCLERADAARHEGQAASVPDERSHDRVFQHVALGSHTARPDPSAVHILYCRACSRRERYSRIGCIIRPQSAYRR